MEKFFESVPQIIEAAAKSDRGLLALLFLILAFLCFVYFRKKGWQVQMTAVVLFFVLAIGAFIYAVIDKLKLVIEPGSNSPIDPIPSQFLNPFEALDIENVNSYSLIDAFSNEETTAKLRYINRLAEITGSYQAVDRCRDGSIYCVRFEESDGEVVLYFPKERNEQIGKLAKEVDRYQSITIQGRIIGVRFNRTERGSKYTIVLVKDSKIVSLPSEQFRP